MFDEKTTKAATAPRSQNLIAALAAANAGLPVFPVRVSKKPDGGKLAKPLTTWKHGGLGKAATTDATQIKKWWRKWPDAVPGAATGGVFVVDLDRDEKKGPPGEEAYRDLGLDPDEADLIVLTPSGGRHLYFDGAEGLTISAGRSGIAPNLDTRGEGGFVFAPGAVSPFGEYRIEKGCLENVRFGILDAVPEPIREALTKDWCDPANDQPAPGGEDIETLRKALAFVPNDGSHDEWTSILMALHHASGGSTHGRALAHGWSAGYPGYDPKEVDAKWRSFGKHKGDPVTAETLYAEARACGWRGIEDDDLDDFDDAPHPLHPWRRLRPPDEKPEWRNGLGPGVPYSGR
jgi:hypothetical protein